MAASVGDQLAVYLRDHRAGAAGGLQLARRCRDHLKGPHRLALAAIVEEIEQDRDHLDAWMTALDVPRSRFKEAVGVVVERLARLKPNGRIVRRTEVGTVLELEALQAGVTARRALWRSAALLGDVPGVPGVDPVSLAERVDRELEQLADVHAAVALAAFGSGLPD
jgi:hypothetical protein